MAIVSEVWLKFEGTEMKMIRWKCVVSMKGRRTSEEFRKLVAYHNCH